MKMKHLRFLYEAFLPREARFPDEKFWSKSGDPIRPARGNSGKGSTGTTAKDWGVVDDPAPESSGGGRVEMRGVDPDGQPDQWTSERFSEEEARMQASDLTPEGYVDRKAFDRPWDYPDVIWKDKRSGQRFRFSRVKR